jgi:WD40 repeat protein
MAFAPDGKWLAAAGTEKHAIVWDTTSFKVHAQLNGHSDSLSALSWSGDSTILATASMDGTVRIWGTGDFKTNTAITVRRRAYSTACSPDGKLLCVGSKNSNVELYRTDTGALAGVLKDDAVQGGTTYVAFSPDGRTVAARGGLYVLLWDITHE